MAAVAWRLKPRLDAAQVMAAVYKGGVALETRHSKSRTEFCLDTGRDRCRSWLPRRATLCGAVKAVLGGAISCVTPAHPDRDDPATATTFFPPRPPGLPRPPALDAPCDTTNCGVPLGVIPAQTFGAVGPMGVATCGECRLYLNGGNGTLTGTMDVDNIPSSFDTTVILYDSNWSPHYYHPFRASQPDGWFSQGLPSNSTHDVIAAAIYWTYFSGTAWDTDGASLQISP